MNRTIYKPPTANLELFSGLGLQSPRPMIFSALHDFEPLDSRQIEEKITENKPAFPDHEKDLLPYTQNNISDKENFTLTIDKKLLGEHHAIRITNCRNFDISSTLHQISPSHNSKFFIQISGCKQFTIEGVNCSAGRNMLFITDSSSFSIRNCQSHNAEGAGIILNNSDSFRILECHFHNNLSAAILVIGNSYYGKIKDCTCSKSRGFFNHDAGFHFCHTSPAITSDKIPEKYHEHLPLSYKTKRPHHIVISNCTITHCRAQGIYLEGAINLLIKDNILLNNNKEGICFDWGSCYNLFSNNIVTLNGERRNLSPKEIKIDFISDYPLLEDGSSSMKLPGIALDNGCMNLIQENIITSNYGGGIKMIRTALFNKITKNKLLYNAIGTNEFIPYFHGITALGLQAINEEFKKNIQPTLDFLPSIFNSISHNTIKESLVPIFFDRESQKNHMSSNVLEPQITPSNKPRIFANRLLAYLRRLFHTKPE